MVYSTIRGIWCRVMEIFRGWMETLLLRLGGVGQAALKDSPAEDRMSSCLCCCLTRVISSRSYDEPRPVPGTVALRGAWWGSEESGVLNTAQGDSLA